MSEFVFRNLSVKVFPAGGGRRQADRECADQSPSDMCGQCSQTPTCSPCTLGDPCTLWCTETPTCDRCSGVAFTGAMCLPGTGDPFCEGVSCGFTGPRFGRAFLGQQGDVRAELGALKERLRREMADVEAAERQLENAGRPRSVEEIDELRSELLAAVAELDERRAELEGDGPTS